ncbi:MAG: DEAD/DEAH box helicase [Chloroflexi bacterium]|nr:DEAD/DEAH box helicase [Chloroflexota bacterium]
MLPPSILDLAWRDEMELELGLAEGQDFIFVRSTADFAHPAPLHFVAYTTLSNMPAVPWGQSTWTYRGWGPGVKPKAIQLDPVTCPQCGTVFTEERCPNPACGEGLCYECHNRLVAGKCVTPGCFKHGQEINKVVRFKRGMSDVCPRCHEAGVWNGYYCKACGWSDRQSVPARYVRAKHATPPVHCPACGEPADSWDRCTNAACAQHGQAVTKRYQPARQRRARQQTPVYRGYDALILDEAHMIKNFRTLRGNACMALRGVRYKMALSGTPIMGYIQDFCRQGQFLCDGDLGKMLFPFPTERGSQKAFMNTFAFYVTRRMPTGKMKKLQEASRIKNPQLFWRMTASLIIRRRKDDPAVADQIKLPPRHEEVIRIEPSQEQQQVIHWVETEYLKEYREMCGKEARGESVSLGALSALMWAQRRAASVPSFFPEIWQMGWPLWPKQETLEAIIADAVGTGRRVVVFTGLNPAAECIIERLRLQGYQVPRVPLTHRTPIAQRTPIIRAFRSDEPDSPDVLVMGLLCGNTGLTLTSKTHPIDVIIYDLDWSPGQVNQAKERVWRPSQRYPVNVYTLVTKQSFDMDMDELVFNKSRGQAQALDHEDPDAIVRAEGLTHREMLDEMARRISRRHADQAIAQAEQALMAADYTGAITSLENINLGALRGEQSQRACQVLFQGYTGALQQPASDRHDEWRTALIRLSDHMVQRGVPMQRAA